MREGAARETETGGLFNSLFSAYDDELAITDAVIAHATSIQGLVESKVFSEHEGRTMVIGQGHHRLLASRMPA